MTHILVPVGDPNPEYLNPYESDCKFNDPLPKDVHLQASLYAQYLTMGLVSKQWIREHIPEIAPDVEAIARQMEREQAEAGAGFVGTEEPSPTEIQGTELERHTADTSADGPSGGPKVKGSKERGLNTGRQ